MTALSRCLLLFLSVSPLAAQIPEQGPPPRYVDDHGNPLPTGAVRRFDRLRFRHVGVTDFAVRPDGKALVSIGLDNTIRHWDMETGRMTALRTMTDTQYSLRTLAADGGVVVAVREGAIQITDTSTGRVTDRIRNPDMAKPACLAVSGDGSRVAVAGDGHRLLLYDTRAGRSVTVKLAPANRPPALEAMHAVFSSDGQRLAVGGVDGGRLVVLDAADGKELYAHVIDSTAAVFLPVDEKLAVIERRRRSAAKGWDLTVIHLRTGDADRLTGGPAPAAGAQLAVSPDGRRLMVTQSDCLLLDAVTGRYIRGLYMADHAKFSPDGRHVVQVAGGRLIVRLTADSRESGKESDHPFTFGLIFSPDGRLMAARDWAEHAIGLWDARAGVRLRLLSGSDLAVNHMTFADGGRTLRVAFGLEPDIWNYDTATGRETPRGSPDWEPYSRFQFDSGFQFDSEGRHILSFEATRDGTAPRVAIVDAARGTLRSRASFDWDADVTSDKWLPDGTLVRSDGRSTTVCDLSTGRVMYQIAERFQAETPDGRWLCFTKPIIFDAIGLRVREAVTGHDVTPRMIGLRGNDEFIVRVCGRTAVVASGSELRVIDLVTGVVRARWQPSLLGDRPEVRLSLIQRLNFFPDGNTLLTALKDGTVLMWDLSSLPNAQLSPTHTNAVLAQWWADLAGDAKPAFAAIWKLAETPPNDLLPFLRNHLRPVAAVADDEWKPLLTELGHPDFRVRARALKKIESLGAGAQDHVRYAAKWSPSADVKASLGRLAERMAGPVPEPGTLRFLRALAVLEAVRTVDARRLVIELTHGLATARETKAAAATLTRMPDSESWRR